MMEHIVTLSSNLLSPIILMFVLGIIASLVLSDLKLPEPLYNGLAIYLLLAIGLKGGVELNQTPISEFVGPALITFFLGILTPIIAYNILRRLGHFDRINASAIAAHYGSVSAVTFIVAIAFGTMTGRPSEGFMPALVAILEVPAIVVGLMIAFTREKRAGSWQNALHEVLAGRSVMLLVGEFFRALCSHCLCSRRRSGARSEIYLTPRSIRFDSCGRTVGNGDGMNTGNGPSPLKARPYFYGNASHAFYDVMVWLQKNHSTRLL